MSHHFEYDTIEDKHPNTDFVKADEILDPDGDLVPVKGFVELQTNVIIKLHRLQDHIEPAIHESRELNRAPINPAYTQGSDDDVDVTTYSSNDKSSLLVKVQQTFNLTKSVKHAYHSDKLYSKILEKPKAHTLFDLKDGLVFTKNLLKWDILCVPHKAFQNGRQVIEIIIDHAHSIIGHFGQFKTTQYIRRYFWWMSMAQDIEAFCMLCGACAAAKDANSKPKGLLHGLPIPDRPWQTIGVDFIGPLPQLNNFDYLLVVIGQLTSQVHLVPTTRMITAKGVVWLILKEFVRLHGILS